MPNNNLPPSKNWFSRLFSRMRAAVPDKRVEDEHFQELHLFIGELRERAQNNSELVNSRLDAIDSEIAYIKNVVTKEHDHLFDLRRLLREARKSEDYAQLYVERNPLVTVRVATYNNSKLLLERAITSVENQTYENWEMVIVGDRCTDDTADLIEKRGNNKIRFYNFPHRSVYPEDPHSRWQVAGSPGMNKAVELAGGEWIAPLDDDDEFSPDHIELLLNAALNNKYEFVYGSTRQIRLATGEERVLDVYPPEISKITGQAAIYPKLLDFFEWDTASWVIDEPGDWNFVRRLMESGVCIGKVDEIVTTIYSADPGTK